MNNGRYLLRPEARAMPYKVLSRSQRDAMARIVAALNEAVDQVEPLRKSTATKKLIDPDRVSRLFFVSGQPGSGKSSIYVTLHALLSKQRPDFDGKYEGKIPGLDDLNGQIRWLEPMDLEVAGDEGENLLAAVLVRIIGATDGSSGIPSKNCRDAIAKLSELENDIGIAWEGNLRARAASLDPDSYSQEVMRAQRTKLGTNTRLREALDELLENQCYGCKGEKIFVLPIDDFYLKPNGSLELLRLLRMVSVPRLFFLIMGDIKTMEALFFEKALADWTNVAGPQVFASLKERSKQEILPRVREMKARYLRKLLPVGQRAIIEWMDWHEALKYRPDVTAPSDGVKTLECLLSGVKIAWKCDPKVESRNLLNYLVAAHDGFGGLSGATSSQEAAEQAERLLRFQEANSALLVLDATPREIVDLWMRISEIQQHKQINGVPEYFWMVVDSLLDAIEEQDFLVEEEQELLRFAFPTSHRADMRIQTDNFSVMPKVRCRHQNSTSNVCACEHLDWEIGIVLPRKDEPPQVHIPPRHAAWIILLHDLALNWRKDSVTANLVSRLLDEISQSCYPSKSKDGGTDMPRKNQKGTPSGLGLGWAWHKSKNIWFHFPLPNLETFRQLDRFLMVWKDGLDFDSLSLDTLVQQWGMAAWIAKGPEDRYKNFIHRRCLSKEEKCDLGKTKKMLFSKDPVLLKLVPKKED